MHYSVAVLFVFLICGESSESRCSVRHMPPPRRTARRSLKRMLGGGGVIVLDFKKTQGNGFSF